MAVIRKVAHNINHFRLYTFRWVLPLLLTCLSSVAFAQWAGEPGDTVRNSFGPVKNQGAAMCRGACGMNCPSSCDEEIAYECIGRERLRRVRHFSCGTHQACRDHDDCLDRCTAEQAEGYDCQAECHTEVMELWPPEDSISWAVGGGPFDGNPIKFEYSRSIPDGPEAFYSCPEGSQRQCGAESGSCVAGNNEIEPQFSSYEGGGAGQVRVSNFRSGSICMDGDKPQSVCELAVDIPVSGEHLCTQEDGDRRCSWYGFQFDYRNAIPGEPMYCQSTGVKGDFIGNIVSGALKSANTNQEGELGDLLSGLQKELNSGKSLEGILSGIRITTPDGVTVGGEAPVQVFISPGVPEEVAVNAASGHMFISMFELYGAEPAGKTVEHYVRCLQQGRPVVETTFRLQFQR